MKENHHLLIVVLSERAELAFDCQPIKISIIYLPYVLNTLVTTLLLKVTINQTYSLNKIFFHFLALKPDRNNKT